MHAAQGTTTAYWWGNEPDHSGTVANVADRKFKKRFPSIIDTMDMDDGYVFMAPVGPPGSGSARQ
jgi:hypothetical protein